MKKFYLIMVALFITMSMQAQQITVEGGNNVKITYDQSGTGPYKVTWKQQSRNGGSVSGIFSGYTKNNKRTGIWSGTITYNNYEIESCLFQSGQVSISRGYSDGLVSGKYTYTDNTQYRNGQYHVLTGQWSYDHWKTNALTISGSFKLGKPDSRFNISKQAPFERLDISFTSGVPSGTWVIQNSCVNTFKFNDSGYMIYSKFVGDNNCGEELTYTEDEINNIESIVPKNVIDVHNVIPYLAYYFVGGQFESWLRGYPKNSSVEDFPVSYTIADFDSHNNLIGNVSAEELENFNRQKQSNIEQKAENYMRSLYYTNCDSIKTPKNLIYYINEDYAYYLAHKDVDKKYPLIKTHEMQIGTMEHGLEDYQRIMRMSEDSLKRCFDTYYAKMINSINNLQINNLNAEEFINNPENYKAYDFGASNLKALYIEQQRKNTETFITGLPSTPSSSDILLYLKFNDFDKETFSLEKVIEYRTEHIRHDFERTSKIPYEYAKASGFKNMSFTYNEDSVKTITKFIKKKYNITLEW